MMFQHNDHRVVEGILEALQGWQKAEFAVIVFCQQCTTRVQRFVLVCGGGTHVVSID